MIQEFNVELTIEIPKELVLIRKTDLEQLKKEKMKGVYWGMSDLERHISKKSSWIKRNILLRDEFKQILDVKNDGFVYYPKTQGERWAFHAKRMINFLEDNFSTIFLSATRR